jgi:hypothetical protein
MLSLDSRRTRLGLVAVVVYLGALAWLGMGAQFLRLVPAPLSTMVSVAYYLLCPLVLIALFRILNRHAFDAVMRCAQTWRPPTLAISLLIGCALRLLWCITFPAVPSSDGATYMYLAKTIAQHTTYEVAGTKSYWPPGYPFFLFAWMTVIPEKWAVVSSQIALYVVATLGVYRFTERLADVRGARIAAILFSVWPNLITLAATAEKEVLVMAFLPWIALGLWSNHRRGHLLAGLGMGAAILVQPSLQMLAPICAVLIVLASRGARWQHGLAVVVGAVIVVAPWTLRNYSALHAPVLVSTNGGDVLYRANNPLATGGYVSHGAIDLTALPEVEFDRESRRQALIWIAAHPFEFARLIVVKHLRLMHDDSVGVYNTLKRGLPSYSEHGYAALKLLANSWWLAVWWLLVLFAFRSPQRFGKALPLIVLWMYQLLIHGVFESSGKYHVIANWTACVLIAVWIAGRVQSTPHADQVAVDKKPAS